MNIQDYHKVTYMYIILISVYEVIYPNESGGCTNTSLDCLR